jgi:hypothetical protein
MKAGKKAKIFIPEKVRLFLLVASAVVFAALLISLFWQWKNPGTVEQELTHYQYQQKANLDYQVFLKPNLLYEEKSLGKGLIYPTNFVDYLQTTLSYEYSGTKQAEIKGKYQVVATMEGIQKEDKKDVILWQKDFLLIPETPFQSADNVVKLEKQLPIYFWAFNDFAEKVQKETGILSNVLLSIKWVIKLEAQTEHGMVQEQLQPVLKLPLVKKCFEVEGELTKTQEGALEEKIVETVPLQPIRIALLGGGAAVSLVVFLFCLIFVQGSALSAYEKKVKQIFKRYEERLVALEQDLTIGTEMVLRVKSVEDLIRIADELCKPVYYIQDIMGERERIFFYILGEAKVFSYELRSPDKKVPLEKEGRVTRSM